MAAEAMIDTTEQILSEEHLGTILYEGVGAGIDELKRLLRSEEWSNTSGKIDIRDSLAEINEQYEKLCECFEGEAFDLNDPDLINNIGHAATSIRELLDEQIKNVYEECPDLNPDYKSAENGLSAEEKDQSDQDGRVNRRKALGYLGVAVGSTVVGLGLLKLFDKSDQKPDKPKPKTETATTNPETGEDLSEWELHYYKDDPNVPRGYFGPSCEVSTGTVEECVSEMDRRLKRDPKLLSVWLAEFNLLPGQTDAMSPEELEDLRRNFERELEQVELRQEFQPKVMAVIDSMEGLTLESLNGGFYTTFNGADGSVQQTPKNMTGQPALTGTTPDGLKHYGKLDCGFQPTSQQPLPGIKVAKPEEVPEILREPGGKHASESPVSSDPNHPDEARRPNQSGTNTTSPPTTRQHSAQPSDSTSGSQGSGSTPGGETIPGGGSSGVSNPQPGGTPPSDPPREGDPCETNPNSPAC